MDDLFLVKKKCGIAFKIFIKLHKLILSLNKQINFRVFPIYVRYSLGEKNIALIYFKGKFITGGLLDLGLNLDQRPEVKEFIEAVHMHYPGISYSIKLKNLKDITPSVIKTIKSIV